MDSTTPYFRTQTELKDDVELQVGDPLDGTARWTANQFYFALNCAILSWADYVKLERTYTLTDGWLANTFEYTLPAYVRPPIFPELRRRIPHYDYVASSPTQRWQDVVGWELVGNQLRVYAPPRNVDGQIVFYAPNSRVPATIPTTNAQIVAADTSVTMGSAVDIDDVGTVKINAEYIGYTGVTRAASTTTLTNLTRALNGSTAATHNSSSNVTWCVGMDTLGLQKLLYDQVTGFLMNMKLTDGATHERANYEKQLGWFDQLAQRYFATYTPQRRTHDLTLNRRALAFR